HTQSACGKQTKCGQCTGPHDTKECPKERVSCVHCGKPYKAWQRGVCKTFQSYLERIQAKRITLLTQSICMRDTDGPQGPPIAEFQIVTNKKRGRQPTPSGERPSGPRPKKGPSRPS